MGFPEHDLQVNRAGAIFLALVPSTFISLTVLGILFWFLVALIVPIRVKISRQFD